MTKKLQIYRQLATTNRESLLHGDGRASGRHGDGLGRRRPSLLRRAGGRERANPGTFSWICNSRSNLSERREVGGEQAQLSTHHRRGEREGGKQHGSRRWKRRVSLERWDFKSSLIIKLKTPGGVWSESSGSLRSLAYSFSQFRFIFKSTSNWGLLVNRGPIPMILGFISRVR